MKTSINLLPVRIQHRFLLKKQLLKKITGIGKIIILTLEAVSLLLLLINLGLAHEWQKAGRENFEKQTFLKRKQSVEREIRYFQAKSISFAEIEKERRTFTKALDILAELIPKEVSFSSLWLDGKSLRMTAKATTGASFIHLVSNLLSSQRFKEVILTESEFLPREGAHRFSISVPLIKEAIFK